MNNVPNINKFGAARRPKVKRVRGLIGGPREGGFLILRTRQKLFMFMAFFHKKNLFFFSPRHQYYRLDLYLFGYQSGNKLPTQSLPRIILGNFGFACLCSRVGKSKLTDIMFTDWRWFRESLRQFLTDYGPKINIV